MKTRLDEVQYVYLDFDGEYATYDNSALNLQQDVTVADSGIGEERAAAIAEALNRQYADLNVVFVTKRPDPDVAYSTVYIGKTDAFADKGWNGLAEGIDKGNAVKDDEAFVFADAATGDPEIVETVSHEVDHIVFGEEHLISSSETSLADFASTYTYNYSDSFSRSSVFIETSRTNSSGYKQDIHYYNLTVGTGQSVSVTITCNSFPHVAYASGKLRVVTGAGDDVYLSAGQSKTFTFTSSTQIGMTMYVTGTSYTSYALNAYYSIKATYAAAKPDLLPFTPTDWSAAIVASTTTGTNTDSSSFTTADDIYVDFAFGNAGGATTTTYYVALYVDGTLNKQWSVTGGTGAGNGATPEDYDIGKLTAGTHTLKLVVDSTGAVSESDETNNSYTKTITVTQAASPDLAPYTPSGWSGSIVASTTTGTNTNASKYTTDDNVYIDFAFSNSSSAISDTFYVALYLDGSLYDYWTASGFGANKYYPVTDEDLGKLSAGQHTVTVVLDPLKNVSESNESNNTFSKTFTVTQASVSADSYESGKGDATRFRATTLKEGVAQTHTLHTATDEDWLVFEVDKDGFYSVVTSGSDTVLQLYSFENQAFGYDDDRGNGDKGSFGTVQLYANTKYYARVTGKDGAKGTYTIKLTEGVVEDAYEKNGDDQLSGASLLTAGVTQKHTIDSSDDADWFKFMVTEEGRYFFSVSTSERDDGQIAISLYGSSGTELDLSGLNSELYKLSGENPYVAANFGTGTYYVKVTSAKSAAAGEYSVYLSSVDSFGATDADDYEDDGPYSQDNWATIKAGETQHRSLNVWTDSSDEYQKDTDYILFEPTETGSYAIRTSGATAPTRMTVYSTDDYGLWIPVGGSSQINPTVENYFQAGQTYLIQLENEYLHLNVESYDLTVEKTASFVSEKDNYESDDTRSAAKTIAVGETQAHSIHVAGDQDWVKFTPTASGYYTFHTGARNGNAGDPDMIIGLYDANGKLLANDDNSFAGWNAMLAYQLTAGTTYYLQMQAARDGAVVPYYTIALEQGVVEDSYDIYMDERSTNDDTMDSDGVGLLELNKPVAHTLHSTTDVDWSIVGITEAGSYTVQTTGSGDTLVAVYDENGKLLASDDDSGVGKNGSVTIDLNGPASGDTYAIYYVKVSASQKEVIPSYNLVLTKAEGGAGDAYEDDDTRTKAKGIVAGETQSRSIHDGGDQDWVLFRPIQSGAYQIQTTGDADMKLDLYDANGKLIASDDDSGTGLNARIGQTLQANTDYYVRAYAYKENVTVDSYGLNVSLLQTSELGDEYESDDDPASAKAIKLGETQAHSIHTAGDVDWVTFTPTVTAEYTIQTVGSGLNCDTQLYLYDSLSNAQSGKYSKWNDDNGSDRNAMITGLLYAGKTYYVKAQAWEDYTIPSYGLKVTQNNGTGSASAVNADEYENDNLSGNCKPIALGRDYTHSIHVQSDTDWVRFYTHKSGTYTIQTTGDAEMSFIVYKRIPGGALVPYEDGAAISGGGAAHNALYKTYLETDNWYYVRITTKDRATTTANYGIRVDLDAGSTTPDAYETAGGKSNDNAPSRANWLTLGYAQKHSIHVAGDQDWLAYKADTTSQVVFAADNDEAAQMRIYFYKKDSSGNMNYIGETGISSYGHASETLSVTAGETYYLKVQAVSSSQLISSYDVTATYVKDAYENDDTSSKSSKLSVGEVQTHNVHSQTDVDWVSFTPTSSGKYVFETSGEGDTYGMLYRSKDGVNTLMSESGSGGNGKNMAITQYLTAGETYYLRVSGENNALVSSYSLSVRSPITQYDEPNDTKTNATVLSSNGKHTGSFHSASDVDYYKVSAAVAGTYEFATGDSSISLEVYVGNSSTPTVSGRGSVSVDLTSANTLYVKASSADGELMNDYEISTSYSKPVATNTEENYVILFAGGANVSNNAVRYYVNFANTYKALTSVYDIPADHIYLLYADGTNTSGDFYLQGDLYNSDMSYASGSHVYAATKSNFKSVVQTVAGIADANDHLLVYVYDHGSGSDDSTQTGEERICTWGFSSDGGVSGAEYNEWMSNIDAGYQTHLFAQCFAGGILDALSVNQSGKKIYGAAADVHYDSSSSYCNSSGIGVGGFAYEVMTALQNGVSNTSEFYKYLVTDNYARKTGVDDPYERGNTNFQIFAQA